MSARPIDVITEPERFLSHADRIATAANISADKKKQWLTHHLSTLVQYAPLGLDLPHLQCLAKLSACLPIIAQQEAREIQREKAIAAAMQAAEERAALEAQRDALTQWLQRETIAAQAERDRIIEQMELAREANIRLNAIVYRWNKPRTQWFRMVRPLSRSAFADYSYQGAD